MFAFSSPPPLILLFQPNSHSLGFFLSLPKPLSSWNPRWCSLDQNALARQNTAALQAKSETFCNEIPPRNLTHVDTFLGLTCMLQINH